MTQKEQIKQIIRTLGVIMFTVGALAVLGTVFSNTADDNLGLVNFSFADDVSLTFVVAAGLFMHFGLQLSKMDKN